MEYLLWANDPLQTYLPYHELLTLSSTCKEFREIFFPRCISLSVNQPLNQIPDMCMRRRIVKLSITHQEIEQEELNRLTQDCRFLKLVHCGIENSDLDYLPQLKHLTIHEYEVTGQILANYPRLETGILYCPIDDADLMDSSPVLKTLEIYKPNNITHHGISFLPSNLINLTLMNCCDDIILYQLFQSCPKLRQLCVSGGIITDQGTIHLAHLPLHKLDISDNPITDIAVQSISQSLDQLQDLDISYCSDLTDMSIVFINSGLPQLQYLNIKHNPHIDPYAITILLKYRPHLQIVHTKSPKPSFTMICFNYLLQTDFFYWVTVLSSALPPDWSIVVVIKLIIFSFCLLLLK